MQGPPTTLLCLQDGADVLAEDAGLQRLGVARDAVRVLREGGQAVQRRLQPDLRDDLPEGGGQLSEKPVGAEFLASQSHQQ